VVKEWEGSFCVNGSFWVIKSLKVGKQGINGPCRNSSGERVGGALQSRKRGGIGGALSGKLHRGPDV